MYIHTYIYTYVYIRICKYTHNRTNYSFLTAFISIPIVVRANNLSVSTRVYLLHHSVQIFVFMFLHIFQDIPVSDREGARVGGERGGGHRERERENKKEPTRKYSHTQTHTHTHTHTSAYAVVS